MWNRSYAWALLTFVLGMLPVAINTVSFRASIQLHTHSASNQFIAIIEGYHYVDGPFYTCVGGYGLSLKQYST